MAPKDSRKELGRFKVAETEGFAGRKADRQARHVDFIPFDLRGVRTIIYDDSPTGFDKLTEHLLRFWKSSA